MPLSRNKYWWFFYVLLFILVGILILTLMKGCESEKELLGSRFDSTHNKLDSLAWAIECGCNDVEYIRDTTIIQDTVVATRNCDEEVRNGGQGRRQEFTHNLGNNPGTVKIVFDMYQIPDKMDVYYNDNLVASTNNYTSGYGGLEFYYPGPNAGPNYCKVVMMAPNNGTSWSYILGCPE
jgi:hypothetical protein